MEERPAKAKVPEAHKCRNASLEKRPCLVGQLPRATEMMPTARSAARGRSPQVGAKSPQTVLGRDVTTI